METQAMPQAAANRPEEPWQLAMFRKGLKKRLRLQALKKLLLPLLPEERCLLLTCGDNNGAMNYFLRELGGLWSWADLEDTSIAEMSALLSEPVVHAAEEHLPFDDARFDRIVVIDVHEHVEDPRIVTGELVRILKPGAQLIITTPNGDERKLAVRIKSLVGMSKEAYGHTRVGVTAEEIQQLMAGGGIKPIRTMWFSGFFTEMLELTINFMYVKVLRKDAGSGAPEHAETKSEQVHADSQGHEDHPEIAPATAEQLRKVKTSYRIYSAIFPAYWLISQLDRLLFFKQGYCVVVEGRRQP
jgi:2-polyprenyl-3-methyl-5-hydroxy-6-metoxy-1,4-benzoquinol methylase